MFVNLHTEKSLQFISFIIFYWNKKLKRVLKLCFKHGHFRHCMYASILYIIFPSYLRHHFSSAAASNQERQKYFYLWHFSRIHVVYTHDISTLIQMNERKTKANEQIVSLSLSFRRQQWELLHTRKILSLAMPRKSSAELFHIGLLCFVHYVCNVYVSRNTYKSVLTAHNSNGMLHELLRNNPVKWAKPSNNRQSNRIEEREKNKEKKQEVSPHVRGWVCERVCRIVLHGKRESATHIKTK